MKRGVEMSGAFISWSGDQARSKAAALRKLIGDVLPEIDARVFMSDADVAAGSFWLTSIADSLDRSSAGVIVVTPENVRNPWLQYEAGALATRVDKKMVIPLLSGIGPSGLVNTPLAAFQALEMSKAAVLKVFLSFASALNVERQEEAIRRSFDKWWPDYEGALISAPVNLAKKPITLDDLYNLVVSLQSSMRSQSEVLSALTSSSAQRSAFKFGSPNKNAALKLADSLGIETTFAGDTLKSDAGVSEEPAKDGTLLTQLLNEALRARQSAETVERHKIEAALRDALAASTTKPTSDNKDDPS